MSVKSLYSHASGPSPKAASQTADFYDSPAWLRVRYQVLKGKHHCECCGFRGDANNPLQVDHIKPRSKYPALELTLSNLQVLCRDCNIGKGAWDETDWRRPTSGRSIYR